LRMKDGNCKVTVLMAVFNAEKWLQETINSILQQTYSDFKLMIVNDSSTDNSEEIILSIDDPRIIYLKNEENVGVTKSVIRGMNMIESEYIIRHDSDDISYPTRFEEQIKFMQENPEIIICATQYEVINGDPFRSNIPESPLQIRTRALFECPVIQPTIIINNKLIKKHRLKYDDRLLVAQDYGLFLDTLRVGEIAKIPKVLLKYRKHSNQISHTRYLLQDHFSTLKRLELLNDLTGLILDEKERQLYMAFTFHRILEKASDLAKLKQVIRKVRNAYFSQTEYRIDKNYFVKLEYEKLEVMLIQNKKLGFPIFVQYLQNYLFDSKIFLGFGLFARILFIKIQ